MMGTIRSITLTDALVTPLGLDMRGDGPPFWREGKNDKLPMSAVMARKLRTSLVRNLKSFSYDYHGADELARRLQACSLSGPCGGGGCPVCWRAMRRLLVQASWRVFRERDAFTFLTWLSAPDIALPGRLIGAQPFAQVEQRLMNIARSTKIPVFGALDLSANEHRDHLFPRHYMPHAHVLVPADAYLRNEEAWNPRYLRNPLVRVPVLPKPYDGRRRLIAYGFKPIIERRDTLAPYVTVDGLDHRADTRDKPLRRPQRVELALMLDRAGLEARVLAYGYDFLTNGYDVWMVPVVRERAEELLATRSQRRAQAEVEQVRRNLAAQRAPLPFHL